MAVSMAHTVTCRNVRGSNDSFCYFLHVCLRLQFPLTVRLYAGQEI